MEYWNNKTQVKDSKLSEMPLFWSTIDRQALVRMKAPSRIVPPVNHSSKSSTSLHILIFSVALQKRFARQTRRVCRVWMLTYNRRKLWTSQLTKKNWPSSSAKLNFWPQMVKMINQEKRRKSFKSSMRVNRARLWSLMSISKVCVPIFLTVYARNITLLLLGP